MGFRFFDLGDTTPPTQDSITARQDAIKAAKGYLERQQTRRDTSCSNVLLMFMAAAVVIILGVVAFGEPSIVEDTGSLWWFVSDEVIVIGWCLSLLVAATTFVVFRGGEYPYRLLQGMVKLSFTDDNIPLLFLIIASVIQLSNAFNYEGIFSHISFAVMLLPFAGIVLGLAMARTIPDVNDELEQLNHLEPYHCPDIIEWCVQHDAVARYQAAVAEQGRLLTRGEYEMMRAFVMRRKERQAQAEEEQKLQAACTRLAQPVRQITAVIA